MSAALDRRAGGEPDAAPVPNPGPQRRPGAVPDPGREDERLPGEPPSRPAREREPPLPDPARRRSDAAGAEDGPATGLRRLARNERDEEQARRLYRIEKLADWLDTRWKLPVVGWRIGGDTLIGLIPGIGDTITAGLGGYLIVEARQAGASTGTIARMILNSGVDWLLGLVPLVGDLLDLGFKSNARNARLLAEDIRRRSGRPAPRSAAEPAAQETGRPAWTPPD